MSCFVHDPAHIDVLVDLADQYQRAIPPRNHGLGRLNFNGLTTNDFSSQELGEMLMKQNARSYACRYREAEEDMGYRYRRTGRTFTHSQALVAIASYEYQACETPDWEKTTAHAFCEDLKRLVVSIAIPETHEDQWSWDDDKLSRSAMV